jgi:hypothetical protein
MIGQEISKHVAGLWIFTGGLLQPCLLQKVGERANSFPAKGAGSLGHVIHTEPLGHDVTTAKSRYFLGIVWRACRAVQLIWRPSYEEKIGYRERRVPPV